MALSFNMMWEMGNLKTFCRKKALKKWSIEGAKKRKEKRNCRSETVSVSPLICLTHLSRIVFHCVCCSTTVLPWLSDETKRKQIHFNRWGTRTHITQVKWQLD